MDNYAVMRESARKRFLTYDPATFRNKRGVRVLHDELQTVFLGRDASVSLQTGEVRVQGGSADFGEAMCLYDWLCDGALSAQASGAFAPVASLPGVMVRGNGLTIDTDRVAQCAAENAREFERICISLGGKRRSAGDISYEIPLFSDLTVLLKFYFPDEDFPASLVLLWDENILQYIRYETVYYLAGCLLQRVEQEMNRKMYIRPKGSI